MSNCPGKPLLRSVALGNAPDDIGFELEEHLSGCPDCRSFLEECWSEETDAPLLSGLANWNDEQEELLPTLRTALSRSFRVRGLLRLEDFPFIESVDGDSVTGRIGDLELRELIGCGGMGAVFRAYDGPLEREVAVKVLRPEFTGSDGVVSLFLDEARAIAAIQHENILPIFDVARNSAETPFFVMPLVEGGRLQDRIDEGEIFDESGALDLALQITRGLSAAHEAGIIHRDIKPSNILLEGTDRLRARLADFGLARAARHGFGEGTLVGTPGYVAPEVARGEKGTARADLYSFGVLLLQLLTGKRPSPGNSDSDPSTSGVPAPLVPLLRSLLSADPEERPESASEVRRKLEELDTSRHEKTRQRESRAKLQRIWARILGSAAVILILGLAFDAIRGWPVSSSAVRAMTGKPISIVGSPKAYSRISEAIVAGGRDCEIVVSSGATLEIVEPIEIENRKLQIRSSSLEAADLFFHEGQKGLIIAKQSELHLEGLKMRFRIDAQPEVDGMITLIESHCLTERCSLRRMSRPPRLRNGATLFAMRYGGGLEIENTALLAGPEGVGVLAVNLAAKPIDISLNKIRFIGETLLHSVSSLPMQDGNQAEFSSSISNSTIYSTNPIRMGRGGERVETTLTIQNSLWQNMGPFLSLRTGPVPAFRDHFSFTATDSIFSIGTSKLIQVGAPDQILTSTLFTDGLPSPEAEWERFLGETAKTRLPRCEWVDWIFRFQRGQPIHWNPDLDLEGKGAPFADEEMKDFQ